VECDVLVGAIFTDYRPVLVSPFAISLDENIVFAFGAIYRSVPDTIITDDIALTIGTIFYCRLVAIPALDGLAIRTEVSIFLAIIGGNAIDKKPATKRGISIAINTVIAYIDHCPSPKARMAKSPAAKAKLKSPRPTQTHTSVLGFFQTAYLYSSFMIECSILF
jgi:hypothetical protein